MSTLVIAAAHIKGPHIDWAEMSPLVVLAVGALVVLLVGLARQRRHPRACGPGAVAGDTGRRDRY